MAKGTGVAETTGYDGGESGKHRVTGEVERFRAKVTSQEPR